MNYRQAKKRLMLRHVIRHAMAEGERSMLRRGRRGQWEDCSLPPIDPGARIVLPPSSGKTMALISEWTTRDGKRCVLMGDA